MPEHNGFRHQQYPTQPAVLPHFEKLSCIKDDAVDGLQLHTKLNVDHIVLVHGTFMGDDPFAVSATLCDLAAGAPAIKAPLEAVADALRVRAKRWTEGLSGDIGNYSEEFLECLQELVGDGTNVTLIQPPWSGQNHHLARADLAVRLVCLLDDLKPDPYRRILLWGHSHAGNGFAILSNLLANDRDSVTQFFKAAQKTSPHWQRAQEILESAKSPHPWAQAVDVVAFGTPVRYGWDCRGYQTLLHVLHHRSDQKGDIRAKPMFPPHSIKHMLTAEYGDWVQAFGIAGTDVVPPGYGNPNRALQLLLEDGLEPPVHGIDTKFLISERVRNVCARWKTGTRCHQDGVNLLVDYEECGRKTSLGFAIEHSLLGHGVATCVDWLPAHLALVIERLQDE